MEIARQARSGSGRAPEVRHHGCVQTVLVVEDERDIREVLRRYLERDGLAVLTTGSGAEALKWLVEPRADLVLLDLGLPDIDGMEVLAAAVARQVPVIALTARAALADRIAGLEHGADDYVTKPFSPKEVVLRVRAVLARGGNRRGGEVTLSFDDGSLVIDPAAHTVAVDGQSVDLTPTEWGLLEALTDAPGRVFTRAELVNRTRGYEFAGYERTVDSHVKNLRRKLGRIGPRAVETVTGVGYRLGVNRDR